MSFLLFAGALQVHFRELSKQKAVVGILATFSLVVSVFLVGSAFYLLTGLFGFEIEFLYCLLFGAIISPTDPIAVMAVLKKAGAPKSLETKITGESLFNDGVGVVVYLVILGMVLGTIDPTPYEVSKLLIIEVGGGAILGLILGWISYRMIHSVENHSVDLLVTLAVVTGGYSFAQIFHLSGPIAMVVAGLFLGNVSDFTNRKEVTRVEHLDFIWEMIDEILNAVLFF